MRHRIEKNIELWICIQLDALKEERLEVIDKVEEMGILEMGSLEVNG